jgi:peptidoglycan/LPS O-acetylase OafA/YrhL
VLAAFPIFHKPVGWRDTLVNLTMFQDAVGVPPVAEVYWTLWAELRFYLLFSLLVWWGLTYRRVVAFCVAWLGAVAFAKAFVPDGTLIHVVLMSDYAPLFIGGIGCYLMYRFRPTLMSWGIVGCSFVLALPVVLFRSGLEVDPGQAAPKWPAAVFLAVCFALVVAVALGWLSWVRGRWLVVVGAMTYPLYLLHLDLGGTVLYLLQWDVPPLLLVALVTGAMVLLAWLVHRHVEQPLAPLMKRALPRIAAAVRRPRATARSSEECRV